MAINDDILQIILLYEGASNTSCRLELQVGPKPLQINNMNCIFNFQVYVLFKMMSCLDAMCGRQIVLIKGVYLLSCINMLCSSICITRIFRIFCVESLIWLELIHVCNYFHEWLNLA